MCFTTFVEQHNCSVLWIFINVIMCFFAGAQKEGAAGFFKGVGKGLVGAVARPTGGIIDMASSTFQGIKRYVPTHQCTCVSRA